MYFFFLLVFTATLALIVVRTQFKEGMELAKSFHIAIAALLLSVVTLVSSVVAFILQNTNKTIAPNPDTKNDGITENGTRETPSDGQHTTHGHK